MIFFSGGATLRLHQADGQRPGFGASGGGSCDVCKGCHRQDMACVRNLSDAGGVSTFGSPLDVFLRLMSLKNDHNFRAHP